MKDGKQEIAKRRRNCIGVFFSANEDDGSSANYANGSLIRDQVWSFPQAFFRMVCSAAAWRGLMMMRVMTAATPIWMRLPGMEVNGTTQLP